MTVLSTSSVRRRSLASRMARHRQRPVEVRQLREAGVIETGEPPTQRAARWHTRQAAATQHQEIRSQILQVPNPPTATDQQGQDQHQHRHRTVITARQTGTDRPANRFIQRQLRKLLAKQLQSRERGQTLALTSNTQTAVDSLSQFCFAISHFQGPFVGYLLWFRSRKIARRKAFLCLKFCQIKAK